MKNENLIKTQNNNNYYYSWKRKELIFLPKKLIEIDSQSVDDEYYLRKKEYLKKYLYFDDLERNILKIDKTVILNKFENLKSLAFETTENCNLNCTYCGYGMYYSGNPSRKKRNISLEKSFKLIDKILFARNKSLLLLILFYGGESLLNIEFVKRITNYISENYNDYNIEFGMTTNGVLLDKYQEYLVLNNFNLLVSLDGDINANEFRKYKNSKPSFKKVFNNLLEIKREYPTYYKKRVSINSVLHSKNNSKYVIEFIEDNLEKHPMTAPVNPYGINNKLKKEFERNIAYKNNQIFKENKIKYLYWSNLHSYPEISTLQLIDNLLVYNITSTCIPFDRKLFYTTNNTVFPCEKLDECYSLGELIEKEDKIEIDFEKVKNIHLNIQKIEEKYCKKCYIEICYKCIYNTQLIKNGFCDEFISKENFINEFALILNEIENHEK